MTCSSPGLARCSRRRPRGHARGLGARDVARGHERGRASAGNDRHVVVNVPLGVLTAVAVGGDHPAAIVPVGNVPIVVDAQEGHPPRLPKAAQVEAHARGALPRLIGHHLYPRFISRSPEPAALALERVGVLMPRIHGVQREGDGALANLQCAHAVAFVEAEPVVLVSSLMLRHARQQDFGAVRNSGSLRGRRKVLRLGGRGAAHRSAGTVPHASPGQLASLHRSTPHALAPARGTQTALSRRVARQRDGSAGWRR